MTCLYGEAGQARLWSLLPVQAPHPSSLTSHASRHHSERFRAEENWNSEGNFGVKMMLVQSEAVEFLFP